MLHRFSYFANRSALTFNMHIQTFDVPNVNENKVVSMLYQ